MTEKDKMQTDNERPLITFMLMAYNHECFVAEAVAAAFAQTYQPLEILLTDDCSSDGSFRIMSDMAAAYRGPHRIILNRNPANLGIGAHINRAIELTGGLLVVAAAADDVSLPERTLTLYEQWQQEDGRADSVFSDAFIVDNEGRRSGRLFETTPPDCAGSPRDAVLRAGVGVPGCTHMFSRKTFALFGPMDPDVMAEDMAIPFRSLLAGGIAYVDAPLVEYRVHGGNISIAGAGRPSHARRARDAQNAVAVLQTWLGDVRTAAAAGRISRESARELMALLATEHYWSLLELKSYSSGVGRVVAAFLRESSRRLGKMLDRHRRSQK